VPFFVATVWRVLCHEKALDYWTNLGLLGGKHKQLHHHNALLDPYYILFFLHSYVEPEKKFRDHRIVQLKKVSDPMACQNTDKLQNQTLPNKEKTNQSNSKPKS
jgi:hypothetical protein